MLEDVRMLNHIILEKDVVNWAALFICPCAPKIQYWEEGGCGGDHTKLLFSVRL